LLKHSAINEPLTPLRSFITKWQAIAIRHRLIPNLVAMYCHLRSDLQIDKLKKCKVFKQKMNWINNLYVLPSITLKKLRLFRFVA